jgi:mRNA interferase MazF
MAEVSRGEIWQYAFTRPDRRRLVLVLTRQEVFEHLRTVTVAPITSTIRGIASEVVLGTEAGLKRPSAVNLDNVATVPRSGLRTYVGTVTDETLEDVRNALIFALGWSAETTSPVFQKPR